MPQPETHLKLGLGLGSLLLSQAIAAAPYLEEVVVTAQKREQNLQDVGVAVAAFSGDALKALGAQSLADVPAFTPNVEMFDEYGSGQPTWVIRGVGLQDFNANNTPASAIYIDDVYLTSNALGGLALFDLAGIEILKGPQGALYGRNTSGGAVLVRSQAPVLNETSGYASAGYASWDNKVAEGAINLPLSEAAALRLSGRWNQSGEGWQTSLVNGAEHGKKDNWALRAQLLWAPTDNTEVLLKLHSAQDQSDTVLGRATGLYDPMTGDFCQPVLEGRLDDSQCAAYATFFDPEFRMPSVQSDDGERTLSDPINKLNNKGQGATLHLTLDVGELSLTSITGWDEFNFDQTFDYDGSQGEFGHQHGRSDISAWSQEFRLAGPASAALNWQLGLELAGDDFEENRDFLFADDLLILNNPVDGLGQSSQLHYRQDTETWAAWAQLDWALSEQWSANLGLRYTDETKSYEEGSFTAFYDGFGVPLYSDLASSTDLQIVSGKLGVNWRPQEDLMLYANLSRGFKSGGIFGGFPLEAEASLTPYDPEIVTAYELGLKSQWLDNRLRANAAVFYYDYRDVQGFLSVYSEVSDTIVSQLGNQGDARHQGAEIDLSWWVTDAFSLQAGASWLDARITDSDVLVASWFGLESLENTRRYYAPKSSYSLIANYQLPVAGQQLDLQMDYSWRASRAGTAQNPLAVAESQWLDAYGLLGARATLTGADQRWSLALWGKNLTDEVYWGSFTTDDVASRMAMPGQPRSVGIDLTYNW